MNKPIYVGEFIKEYLRERKITQKEVCEKTFVSERHLSNVINGKQKLSYELALKLELVMPDVQAEFWLALEQEYHLQMLRAKNRYIFLHFDEDSEEEYEGEYEELREMLIK